MDPNDYYSIDSILASNQRLQCTFKTKVEGLGYLDGGSDQDINVNTKIALPYWLAPKMLLTDWADFTIPAPYSSRVKNALNAEPRSVKLSALVGGGGEWYGFGTMITQLLNEEEGKEMSDMLIKTFQLRLVDVMDQAQHFGGSANSRGSGFRSSDTGADFREGLDATERELFSLAQDSAMRTKQWYESIDRSR